MKLATFTKWQRFDWGIFVATVILILLGLATLYSLELNLERPDFTFVQRQGLAVFLGLIAFVLFLFIDFRHLKDLAYILYGLGCLMLASVLVFGITIHGTTGWFLVGGLTFQPVELFKLIFIIVLAKFLSTHRRTINHLMSIIQTVFFMILPVGLIYLQPDLGSLILLFVIWFGLLLVMKLRLLYVIFFLVIAATLVFISWQFLFEPYQKERLLTFVNPSVDQKGAGYHVRQSKIAIGSGRYFGRGLGLGTQSSLNFLPEQETDFIFAVISESLGFVGGSLVILVYAFLMWRIVRLAQIVQDDFGVLLTMGIFFWFAFQGFANIAMNLGMAPVFGVPLPFLSFGGSSLIVSVVAIGILESVSLFSPREKSL